MTRDVAENDTRPNQAGVWNRRLMWLALGFALLPVAARWLEHAWTSPGRHALSSLVPALLFVACLVAQRPEKSLPARSLGLILLTAGLGLEMMGLAGETATLAYLGAALAILGLGRFDGSIPLLAGLLLLAAIPIPTFLLDLFTPGPETFHALIVARLLSLLGAAADSSGSILIVGPLSLEFQPYDSGLRLAWIGAAAAVYSGLRRNVNVLLLFIEGALGGVAGILAQVPALLITGLLLWAGQLSIATFWTHHLVWIVFALLVLGAGRRREQRVRAAARARAERAQSPVESFDDSPRNNAS